MLPEGTASSGNFRQVQDALSAWIRDPDACPGPQGVERRRLEIYRDLFYRNVEGFLSRGFPALRRCYSDENWHQMARDFLRRHACHTPYFHEIGREFLSYLEKEHEQSPADPPFLLELAHYERMGLELEIAETEIPEEGIDPKGDLLQGCPVVSPLACSFCYRFPVHLVAAGKCPSEPSAESTFLVLCRDRQDRVQHLEGNPVTARLLELLDGETAGLAALDAIADQLGEGRREAVHEGGQLTLEKLRAKDIVLGVRSA